jgi:regulator of ribonuclease activity A
VEKISTPDICDDHEGSVRVLDSIFNNYGGNRQFYGKVVTVKCHEDNSLVKQQAEVGGDGNVLVVDGGGSLRRALLGDMIAEIAELNLGVKALNTIPLKTEKRGLGDLNVPVTFAGQTIVPGEWIYCDNNGIVISTTKLP